MVLINELTVEQINAALLHLQRSKDEVVGGNKGTTIQNISISNSGGGGGNNVDYSGAIQNLANNIEKNSESIEGVKVDVHNLEETIRNLSDAGISDLSYDNLSHQLTITTENGDTFQTQIIQDVATLSFDSATNELSITTGEQTQTITLPAQVQSDWTQTDNTEPDFIKNKIPIWITSGSADDNMSPVDVVEAGNTRPVTSGGVAQELSNYPVFINTTMTDANQCVSNNGNINRAYYYAGNFTTNVPKTGYAIIRCYQYGGSIVQFIDYSASSTIETYRRYIRYDGQVTTSWLKLTTTADIVNEVTANNMQSVTSNAVYNALLSHPIRVWATVQTVYYNLPVNIPKSFFTLGRTYIISLTGSYANVYSGMYLLFYGAARVSSYTIYKTYTMNDLTVGTDNVTISFVQQVGIGADSARVDVIML